MSAKNIAVFGIYSSRLKTTNGVQQLRLASFGSADVSVLFSENGGSGDLGHEKNTKLPEGVRWLAGIGALTIPGFGAVVAAGPIMGWLSGVDAGSAVDGIAGALIGMGMPEYVAKRYEGRVRKSGFLVSVHCDNWDWVRAAKRILEETGAQDISSTGSIAQRRAMMTTDRAPRATLEIVPAVMLMTRDHAVQISESTRWKLPPRISSMFRLP